jgi:hypothetical protein
MKPSVDHSALRHLLRATEENMKNLKMIQSNWKLDVSRIYLIINVKFDSVVIDFETPCGLAGRISEQIIVMVMPNVINAIFVS